ncbi:MAG: HlyD family type I secretion periplasmic adaptor subunit [Pseudomonadota bacterium]
MGFFKKNKKPIQQISGNDPNLAKAMQEQVEANMSPAELEEANKNRWMKAHTDRLEAQAKRFFETDEDLPLATHITLFVILGSFIAFIIWASFAPLDEVVRGDGKIIPSSEVQKISSLEGGIIEEIMVSKGEEVQQGQILVRLSDVAASSDLGANEARYLGLLATVTRLQAEVEGKIPEFPKEVMQKAPQSVTEEMNAFRANQDNVNNQIVIMEQQKSQRSQELNELQVRASDVRGQLRLIQEELQMVEPLVARGSAPKLELLQLQRQVKEKQTELNGVTSAIPRARSAIAEANGRIAEVRSTARAQSQTELSAKLIEMNSIKEGLVGLKDRKTRTELRSPVNGYIQDIKVTTIGGVVQPGAEFIEVVPKDDKLLVEARVNPKDIAFIASGDEAVVKITAYDFSVYGGLRGNVVFISADAVTNEEGESFYVIQVETQDAALERRGEILPIIPGMITSVDILTGKKTVMEYLLKPFIKTLNEAMNER